MLTAIFQRKITKLKFFTLEVEQGITNGTYGADVKTAKWLNAVLLASQALSDHY